MTAYRAVRLPVHNGPAAWAELLGPQPLGPALETDTTADIVIVGAGFAGLSAARRLAQLQPGARVVLLDAGRVAEGTAGRNSGFMIDLPHDIASDDYAGPGNDAALIALNRQAIAFGRAAVEEYGIDPNFFDPAGKVNGAVGAAGDAHNRSYAAHLARLGEPAEMLDAQAMAELTGSRLYLSGLYTPGTVMLQPAGYVRGLAAGVARRVALYENSPVTGFARTGGTWQVSTPKARVETPRIVLATNGHLESFGFARRRLMHIMLYASMSVELDAETLAKLGGAPRWGVTPADPMGTTMRRIDAGQGGHRIVTRTCASFRPNMETGPLALARAVRMQRRKFDARFPQLAGLPFEYSWAGHLCLSRNGVSVMGEVAEGVVAACCQNGLGTTRGTLSGIGAAELALGERSEITDFFAAEAEPARLPPEPFATLGANTYLSWREWRVGLE